MFTRRSFLVHSLAASGALFAGCSEDETPAAGARKPIAPGSRVAVVLYSYTGNTLAAGEIIARLTHGTLLRLEPQTPYPADYTACTRVAKEELACNVLRPLAPFTLAPESYDVLFVGSPNWWGTVAPCVRTFLADARATRGKLVIPFFTHGGGGMQRCSSDFAKLVPEAAECRAGQTFPGHSIRRAEPEIAAFLAACGF